MNGAIRRRSGLIREGLVWLLLLELESWMTLCGQRLLLSGLLECYPSFWDEALAGGRVFCTIGAGVFA